MSGTVSLLPQPEAQFCDANGAPLAGGSVATYIPGTTTPSATWQDAAGSVLNTNPIILDAAGRAIIWGSGSYRLIVRDSAGNLIYDQVTSTEITQAASMAVAGNLTVGGALTAGASTLASLAISQDGGGTVTLPNAVSITRVAGTASDADLVDITQTVTHVGGSNTLAQGLQVRSIAGNTGNDGPATNIWNLTARLESTALKSSAAGVVDSQHIALAGMATRNLPSGGVPAGKTLAEVFSLYLPTVDTTNLPSSTTNSLNGCEMDMEANNLDDTMQRQGLQIITVPHVALASGGYPNEVGRLITFSGHGAPNGQVDGFCKFGIWAGVPYSVSLFDARTAGNLNTTVATTLSAPGTTVAVTNVWGCTSAGALGQPVSVSNPLAVTINGNAYSVTGFTTTAGSTAGTITTTANVSVADGTAGNKVVPNAHTIWLGSGQDIAFSDDGSANISVDGSGGFVFKVFSGPVMTLSSAGEALLQGNILCQSIGLFGAGAPAQQTVTGSRGGNAALASLLTALAAYGLIINGTTT